MSLFLYFCGIVLAWSIVESTPEHAVLTDVCLVLLWPILAIFFIFEKLQEVLSR